MRPPLTPRQAALLDAIRSYVDTTGIPPTVAELGRMAGISSTSVVCYNLDALEGRGLIRRTPGIARSIVLVERDRVPADVRRTLLQALRVEREENGVSADNAAAVRWVKGEGCGK